MSNVKTDTQRYAAAIEISVTRGMKADIAEAARDMGLSVSAFCRLIIKERIEQGRTSAQPALQCDQATV